MLSRAASLAALLGGALVTGGVALYSVPAAMVVAGLLLLAAAAWSRAR